MAEATTAPPLGMVRLAALTSLTMLAFAANSLLCRAALGEPVIDAASFTAVRLASGALTLWLLLRWRGATARGDGDWPAAGLLFLYAIAFSFAYLSLSAATGALILFGFVQLTMQGAALLAGERLPGLAWAGLALAVGGLVYLLLPGLDAPDPLGALLMATAGVAWGLYSLRGRGVANPLRATAGNFMRSVPLALLALLPVLGHAGMNAEGASLAVASGALASGLGYALWYRVLPRLKASQAATVQLSVPVIAALGGVLLLGEPLGGRLVAASLAVLGGITLVLRRRG